jgi:hypothetical protein
MSDHKTTLSLLLVAVVAFAAVALNTQMANTGMYQTPNIYSSQTAPISSYRGVAYGPRWAEQRAFTTTKRNVVVSRQNQVPSSQDSRRVSSSYGVGSENAAQIPSYSSRTYPYSGYGQQPTYGSRTYNSVVQRTPYQIEQVQRPSYTGTNAPLSGYTAATGKPRYYTSTFQRDPSVSNQYSNTGQVPTTNWR